MKSVEFQNIYNQEKFYCENIKQVSLIDGIEYLSVQKPNSNRKFLMRKDSLKLISKSKK